MSAIAMKMSSVGDVQPNGSPGPGDASAAAAAVAVVAAGRLAAAAPEELHSARGPRLSAFLSATFGNAAELIIAIVALRANHVAVVKASSTGSIVGNLLLVFGGSCSTGGLT